MARVAFFTEKAPLLLTLMGVEDEDDLQLLLLLWTLAKVGRTISPEMAKLN